MKRKLKKSRILISISALFCALAVFCSACNLFGEEKHVHEFINFVYNNDATCLNDGTETAKCEGCDETYRREKEGTKKPHSFVNYKFNYDATCTENGTETAKCENCHMTDTRKVAGSIKDHSFTHYVSNDDATCAADGTETAKCDYCNATDMRTEVGSKKEHSFTRYVSNSDATCTADGTETAKCDNCNATDTRTEADSQKEHVFVTYKPNGDATCIKNGTETAKCENCRATDTREIPDSKTGHSFTNFVPNNDATTEKDGTKTAKCDTCDEEKTVPDEGSKLSGGHVHSYSETKVDPTCIEKGYILHSCECGESEYKDNFIDELGHDFVNYKTNDDATCTENGTETAKCERCDETDTREIANSKTAHSFVVYVSDDNATCTQNGTETAKCENCNATDTQEIPDSKTAHSFTNYVSNNDATTEKDGTKSAKCDHCGAVDTVTDEGTKLPSDDGDVTEGKKEEIDSAKLSIHFLELGNKYTGDCTFIKCGDTEILIDAGSRKDSAATIKTYVDQYCTDGVLEYVIATHAHQDHIAGFVGNSVSGKRNGILYEYKIGTLIQFGGSDATTQIYNDYLSAVEAAKSNGTTVYTATQCWYETDGAKKQYFLDENKTVSINILYNYYYDHKASDENEYSVCMLLSNVEGNKTYNYLFTGDLEKSGESKLVENNELPEVELFKGGHHGSYTASTDNLLSVIKPKNIAICCCCGTTEYTSAVENTFPAQAALDRMAKYTENIYCTTLIVDYSTGNFTSMNGNIVFYYKDRLKLYCTNNNTILKETAWFKENRTWNP